MTDVKIIPISKLYRENWEKIFSRNSSTGRDIVCSDEDVGSSPTSGSKYSQKEST